MSDIKPVRYWWQEKRATSSDIWDDQYDVDLPAPHPEIRNVQPLYSAESLQTLEQDNEWLRAERDAAFAMSKCECSEDEACRNLVAAEARATAAEAENQRLRAQIEAAESENNLLKQSAQHSAEFATQAIEAKEAALEEARKVIEPFADACRTSEIERLCLGPDIDHWSADGLGLTLGHLRAARRFMEENTNAEG